jgi:hypothetical protein
MIRNRSRLFEKKSIITGGNRNKTAHLDFYVLIKLQKFQSQVTKFGS